jgi:hypothetical protein
MPSTLKEESSDPLDNAAGFLSDFSKALVTGDSVFRNRLSIQGKCRPGQKQTPGRSATHGRKAGFLALEQRCFESEFDQFTWIRRGALELNPRRSNPEKKGGERRG